MKQLQDLMREIMWDGDDEMDRTGVGTRSVLGAKVQFDLGEGFPATTTKRLALRAVIGELLWFIRGGNNVNDLREITYGKGSDKRTIWDDNYENQAKALGYEQGYMGPIYGYTWRNFNGVDQLAHVIEQIKTDPSSRRIIVSAWNASVVDAMTLPPCHVLFRFSVKRGRLNLTWYQRSCDVFLGLPFNIASYAVLLTMVANITGYAPGILTGLLDDTHLYLNHFDQVEEMIKRQPKDLPELVIHKDYASLTDIENLTVDDFELVGYDPHPAIKAPMAV
ncbi:thymidylate synthase [Aeromonas phage Ahp1_CNU-2021]|nr:thymidylate synthase [Aeromonas phage Ahp1_CNU-2021]